MSTVRTPVTRCAHMRTLLFQALCVSLCVIVLDQWAGDSDSRAHSVSVWSFFFLFWSLDRGAYHLTATAVKHAV